METSVLLVAFFNACLTRIFSGRQLVMLASCTYPHVKNVKVGYNEYGRSCTDINYTVVLDNKICPQKCSMLCPECNICIHMFTCNCADALIRTTICKHIHLVARYTLANSQINKEKTVPYCNVTESTKLIEKQQSPIDSTLEVSPEFSEEYVDKMSLLETLQDKEQLCDIAEIRSTVQTQLSILSADLCCVHDRETLKHVREFITSAINLGKPSTAGKLLCKKNQPVNKLVEKQRSFFQPKERGNRQM